MPFNDVDCLSDDSGGPKVKVEVKQEVPVPKKEKPVRDSNTLRWKPSYVRSFLGRLVCQVCKCDAGRAQGSWQTRNCLKQFRTDVEPLFQLRMRLHRLHKADMDREVWCAFLKSRNRERVHCSN